MACHQGRLDKWSVQEDLCPKKWIKSSSFKAASITLKTTFSYNFLPTYAQIL